MSKFIQLHLLTSYPPANLNRDDLGRPKTAMMGGANRLRVSSQSLKRAWRTSDIFRSALTDHLGVRTKEMGRDIYQQLLEKGVKDQAAFSYAQAIANVFGKLKTLSKKEKADADENKRQTELEIEQLAHFSPEEQQAITKLIDELANGDDAPSDEQLALLRKQHTAADIALFGRMLASSPAYNTEAAAQVAHAISVHKVAVEDDFFTAVDDLNSGEEDMGAAHMGETEFAAGLFYLYLCIDRELLIENLSNDSALADKTLAALIESAATIAPSGKQNSFASRARASYILCEKGNQQPRSLSVAFLKPIGGNDLLAQSIQNINETVKKMDQVYGACADRRCSLNAETGEGSLQDIIECISGD
ncbi:MAG: CRISPR-associated protein Cse4 [Gammaproteobacteria bacterium (ex Lamellibrachia satsuma)]|nr:MAG: type I-E CRISPR-associated protein Cas7/Cse4/CasC [Gammaproteobacteria bacterium (ex Lamellibrachia satsuma)]RRS32816.1 MAG: CRISPR-associated protein Cse4 [Gammaproteobacteria bacterium (ex Lamellibrachia satsuma)]RRS35657.1 MAG: CRISPR-associated protein Cse4 [Gammaproteobacteria bacterium (ex Lamellibrachia satsuma)]